MKKIAYIISGRSSNELLNDNLFAPLEKDELRTKASILFFVADGVYHLMKGSRSSKALRTIMERDKSKIIGCEISIKNRKLQNFIIEGVVLGNLNNFYDAAKDADHIISF